MKLRNLVAPVLFGAFGLSTGAHAAPEDNNATDGGRIITNNATLDYKINGQSQTRVDAFENVLVDVKVDFDVSRVNSSLNPSTTVYDLDGTPGTAGDDYYLVGEINLTNTGNAPTFFTLTAANVNGVDVDGASNGPVDNNDVGSAGYVIYLEDGGSAGLSADDDAYTGAFSLAKNATQRIYVVAKQDQISGNDGDVFGTELTAVATQVTRQLASINSSNNSITYSTKNVALPGHNAQGAAPDSDLAFVYADSGNNATESVLDGLLASFPDLNNGGNAGDGNGNFTKTATVISDPFNNTTNPKAIPGAVVEYVIKVSNTGSADATDVIVRDPIPADTTYDATFGVKVLQPSSSDANVPGTATVTDADLDSSATSATQVVVDLGTLSGGANAADKETNFIVFRVTIN